VTAVREDDRAALGWRELLAEAIGGRPNDAIPQGVCSPGYGPLGQWPTRKHGQEHQGSRPGGLGSMSGRRAEPSHWMPPAAIMSIAVLRSLRYLLIGLLGVGLVLLILWAVVVVPPRLIDTSAIADPAKRLDEINELRTNLLAVLAGLAIAAGAFVGALNFRETQRQNRAIQEQNRALLDLQRRGQVTERFSRAIDQLGQRGDDKLDVRIGAVYALEQIARDTSDLHWPIVEILTAFLREHAPRPPDRTGDVGRPAADIQAIISVVGRRDSGRDPLGRRVYMHRVDLGGADLRGAVLRGALLAEANLHGAVLNDADLRDCDLRNADLSRARVSRTQLDSANLVGANLAGARGRGTSLQAALLRDANLDGALLGYANFEGADLRRANLQRAWLRGSNLRSVTLMEAQLRGATLMAVDLHGTDLTQLDIAGVTGLTTEQLAETRRPPH
jgi:uncharacterized protein YjbI with pentapeptide repeats